MFAAFVAAHGAVDRVFYINSDIQTERRASFEVMARERLDGIPFERFSAVLPEEATKVLRQSSVIPYVARYPPDARDRTLAIYSSHVQLLKAIRSTYWDNTDSKYVMVLEDDAILQPDWQAKLANLIKESPVKSDILKICAWGNVREENRVSEGLFWARGPFRGDAGEFFYAGTCGYVVQTHRIDHVLSILDASPAMDIDEALLSHDGILTFQARSLLATHGPDGSQVLPVISQAMSESNSSRRLSSSSWECGPDHSIKVPTGTYQLQGGECTCQNCGCPGHGSQKADCEENCYNGYRGYACFDDDGVTIWGQAFANEEETEKDTTKHGCGPEYGIKTPTGTYQLQGGECTCHNCGCPHSGSEKAHCDDNCYNGYLGYACFDDNGVTIYGEAFATTTEEPQKTTAASTTEEPQKEKGKDRKGGKESTLYDRNDAVVAQSRTGQATFAGAAFAFAAIFVAVGFVVGIKLFRGQAAPRDYEAQHLDILSDSPVLPRP